MDFSGDSQGQLLNILWLDLVHHQPCAIHDPSYEANKMFAHRNNISHISSTSLYPTISTPLSRCPRDTQVNHLHMLGENTVCLVCHPSAQHTSCLIRSEVRSDRFREGVGGIFLPASFRNYFQKAVFSFPQTFFATMNGWRRTSST